MRASFCSACGSFEASGAPAEATVPAGPPLGTADKRCVLCGKARKQVKKLILGLHGGVCLECIALCNEIIAQQPANRAQED